MKKSHFDRINDSLTDIRNAIKAHHNETDKQIAKYHRQVEDDTARLNEATLSFETKKNRVITQGAVRFSADQAIRSIGYSFDDIQKEIDQWSIEPPTANFLTLMETVNTFNLDLSVDEIKVLSQAAAGAYFAEKVLSGFAEHSGLKFPFETIESLNQMIRNAKEDCYIAVNAYAGSNAESWITDEIGKYSNFHRAFAMTFLERDQSSLIDLETALSTATDSTISLIPNEQQRIAAMFDNVLPENRFAHMKQLIMEHPEIENLLKVFDRSCYEKAKAEIREQRESEYQESLSAVREASDRALEAKRAALSASMA